MWCKAYGQTPILHACSENESAMSFNERKIRVKEQYVALVWNENGLGIKMFVK